MKREVVDYIEDIIESMTNSLNFAKDMNYEEFVTDTKTIYAVIRAIEIIGEGVKNIPEDIREKYPEIPWKSIAGMRDKVIHAYFGVNLERVWRVVQKNIPELKPKFEEILKVLK
ncbi:DUF86 domain-containing protein [Candidatus Calescamantes bacterium]|nr:DUF86 domain-containing protein [Candidatus Calescamantes bacterium]